MRLATCSFAGRTFLAAQLDGWIADLARLTRAAAGTPGSAAAPAATAVFTDMLTLLDGGDEALSLARGALDFLQDKLSTGDASGLEDALYPLDAVAFLPPILRPGKLICVGLNYHTAEAEFSPSAYPVLFHKVATSLTGHDQPILIPRITSHVVYEGELAVVVGRRGKHIARQQAEAFIAGYTIANDVGAPDLQRRTSQWTTGKMLDTFCPLGPTLVTRDEVPDAHGLGIRTILNGELVQSGTTAEMIFDVPYLVSYISELVTLEPGDLILTGSPKRSATGLDPRTPMQPGDRVSVEIEGLGVLSNPVLAEE